MMISHSTTPVALRDEIAELIERCAEVEREAERQSTTLRAQGRCHYCAVRLESLAATVREIRIEAAQ